MPLHLRLWSALVALHARCVGDQRGQTTAEYALVLVVAAVIGSLVLTWATKTHAVGRLFDVTIGRVVDLVGGG